MFFKTKKGSFVLLAMALAIAAMPIAAASAAGGGELMPYRKTTSAERVTIFLVQ